jgi:NADPH-dependent 2,4-dienoyl-CoA reductase/sulfur reductase-like enzyme
VAKYLKSLYEAKGVTFLLGKTALRIEGSEGSRTVVLSDGTRLPAGFVVAGLGIQPAVDCLEGTGLVENGAVPVDALMRTRAADIFAAGDIAAVADADGGSRRNEHWVVAERQGVRAALAMLDADPGPAEVSFFWSRQAGLSLKFVGHAAGFDQVAYRGTVEEGKFIAGYYRAGVLRAAAAIGLAQDLVGVEGLMRRGVPPTAVQLSDEGFDLIEAARRA